MSDKNKEIHVPALVENGRVIVPESWLGQPIDKIRRGKRYVKHHPIGPCHSFITEEPARTIMRPSRHDFKISRITLPSLAVLRHAHFDKNPDGSWVSPEFRENPVNIETGVLPIRTEYTSTLRYNRDRKRSEVVPSGYTSIKLEDGRRTFDALEPPNGWVTRYCMETGYPEETSDRENAEKVFGPDASYFHAIPGCNVVLVGKWYPCRPDKGPFPIGSFLGSYETAALFSTAGRRCRYVR